jgi:hypothetical protein
MPVAEQVPVGSQTGNGSSTTFAFAYPVFDAADLVVSIDGTVKTLGVDYALTGVGGASGTIVFTTAPASGAAIVHFRSSALERETDYLELGDLRAAVVNRDFDRIWLALLELQNGTTGPASAVRAPGGETLTSLPVAAARADRLPVFDADGDAGLSTFTATEVASAVAAAYAAGSTADAVTFLQSGTGAESRSVQDKLRESVSVTDFGAVGDGVTDDTAALQRAFDSGVGQVAVTDGTYRFTAGLSVPPNCHIKGTHGLARKYNPSTARCRLVYDGPAGVALRLTAEAVTGAVASTVSDLVIQQGNTNAGVAGIAIGGPAEPLSYALSTKLSNLLVSNFTGVGVENYGSWNCTITDVLVHGVSSNRTGVGFKFDNTAAGATSCYLTNCAAEECTVGFQIGSSSVGRVYSYSSLINTYVDGCVDAYKFLGDGTSTRVVHVYNAGAELIDGGSAIIADGAYVVFDGLSLFANGSGFSDVIRAENGAVLTISNSDFLPQSGFGLSASTSIVTADSAVVRFLNGDVTTAAGEVVETNGGRVDVLSKDRFVFRSLERFAPRAVDVTVSTRNLTYSGFSEYRLSTSAGSNQAMEGTPIVSTTGLDNGEVIRFTNTDATYEITLRTEDIVANTGVVKHPDNVSGSGVVLQPSDYAEFVKKADGKLHEIKRFA